MTIAQDPVLDETPPSDETPAARSASRRSFVTKGALAAAVGAAASVAIKSPASAANGDFMNVGNADTGTSTTQLSGGTTFRVIGGFSAGDASIYGQNSGSAGAKYGVHGSFSDSASDAAGVYGANTHTGSGAGYGVLGESLTGTGIYGRHTDSQTAGTGVHGRTESTSGGSGVLGVARGTEAYGVRGRTLGTRSTGVSGEATNGGTGVYGESSAGVGVNGSGTLADLLASGSGIIQMSTTTAGITATTAGTAGSIARSDDGTLWYCYAANAWRQLDLAAGIYTAITPGRVYDSRFEAEGRFSGGENRTISVADSRSVTDYSVDVADLVPAGATSVTGNVVAIAPDANGFLAINPGGVTAITASTLNFTAGQNIANGSTFALNANREVECVFGPGASAHVALDITGYTI